MFAADGASADAASEVLAGGNVPHVVYHKSRPMGEQAAALATLREQPGCVMVCTDAAARGLDVEDIKHVVQVSRGRGGWGLWLGGFEVAAAHVLWLFANIPGVLSHNTCWVTHVGRRARIIGLAFAPGVRHVGPGKNEVMWVQRFWSFRR